MHPEILRELAAQRGQEMRDRAHQGALARMSRRRRRVPDVAGEFAVPAIPDYLDGSFRTEPAVDQAASEAGQAPAVRDAA
jgi:hypothetical protein